MKFLWRCFSLHYINQLTTELVLVQWRWQQGCWADVCKWGTPLIGLLYNSEIDYEKRLSVNMWSIVDTKIVITVALRMICRRRDMVTSVGTFCCGVFIAFDLWDGCYLYRHKRWHVRKTGQFWIKHQRMCFSFSVKKLKTFTVTYNTERLEKLTQVNT